MADVVANGVRLHIQRLGKGPPHVLFVHGLVMDNLSSFYFTLANPVAKVCESILVDLRGHGRSARPKTGYGLDTLRADLADLIGKLGIAVPIHVIGNSFGGLLALALAAREPERVASLVLLDAHLGRAGWGDAMAKTLSLQGEARDKAIIEGFQHWLGRSSKRKTSRLAETATALVESTTLLDDLRASPSISDEALRRVTCPVLALYGEQSDLKPQADALQTLVPQVRLVVRPKCTHSILWEQTEWVKAQVLDWLHEQGAPAPPAPARRSSRSRG